MDKQTRVTVSGIDRQQVGQVAAEIRGLRKPDPYKQKGIRYVGEVLKKKAGKAGATDRGEVGMMSRPKKTSGSGMHDRIRKKIAGTPQRPRLAVFRSQSAHLRPGHRRRGRARRCAPPPRCDKDLQDGKAKRGANVAAAKAVGPAHRRPRQGEGRRARWSSTAAASSTTAASRLWPTPPARAASSSRTEDSMRTMHREDRRRAAWS